MKKLTLISMLLLFTTGCAVTRPMRASLGRGAADVIVTRLLDKGLSSEATLVGENATAKVVIENEAGVIGDLRALLDTTQYASVYLVQAEFILGGTPGSTVLLQSLEIELSGVTGLLEKHTYIINQILNQATLAAVEHKNVKEE